MHVTVIIKVPVTVGVVLAMAWSGGWGPKELSLRLCLFVPKDS